MNKVCVVIPVYNEEEQLKQSIEKILKVCKKNYQDFVIIIADNASSDKTLEIAKRLSVSHKEVKFIHLDKKGRGHALKAAWTKTDADIMCFMDTDLSTDLRHLKQLTDAIEQGYDIAFGSRHHKQSRIKRGLKREILSRGYILLLKLFFNVPFTDAQCGFKAVNKKVVRELIPKVEDNEWFFDTELLIKGDTLGYKLKEIPVRWTDDEGSTVEIPKTVLNYLINMAKLRLKKFKGFAK